ncbi:chaperone NapD [Roseateles sp.]|uniref:chaperone NapD n=1 Tax=Roseateles sp. TaxID=1971397 RepID=UPI0031E0A852
MTSEMHIASVVVQAQPRLLDDVASAVQDLPGARIHGRSDAGKLVVTLDGSTADDILDQVRAMQQLRGVVNVALVYQHIEPEPQPGQDADEGGVHGNQGLHGLDNDNGRVTAATDMDKEFDHEHTT